MPLARPYPYDSISLDIKSPYDFTINPAREYEMPAGVKYTLNSLGFRSDEFKEDHDGDHVLFLGCSVTYGCGIHADKTWSWIVYNELSKKRKLSGYFNLSYPGAASTEIIFNAMKYINKYGKPSEIYFLLPEIMRGIHLNKNSALLHSIQMYLMFENFCKTNGIKLISRTWDIEDISDGYIQTANDFYDDKFESFNKTDYRELAKIIYQYIQSHKGGDMYLIAGADSQHFGSAHNYGFAQMFLKDSEAIDGL